MALKDLFERVKDGEFTITEVRYALEKIPEEDLLKKIEQEFEKLLRLYGFGWNLPRDLLMKISGDKLASKLEHLIWCRTSLSKNVRDLARILVLKIPVIKLVEKFKYLSECLISDDTNVISLVREIESLIDLSRTNNPPIIDKITEIINK